MATFYPSMNVILHDQMEKHTAGELALLKELANLPDEFAVYFQPHINFAHPDMIILHPQGGVLIIEVKDWTLSSYLYTAPIKEKDFGYLQVNHKSTKLTTPFAQVCDYKNDFFQTLCPALLSERIRLGSRGRNVYGVIKTAVYFHRATNADVLQLFGSNYIKEINGIKKYKTYTTYWCKEDLSTIHTQILKLMFPHSYYSANLHHALRTFLVPSEEWLEQTEGFDLSKLSPQQHAIAQCTPGQWTRIKGTAGSGKTLIIAQKAINCFEKKKKPVLILTYNITLRNYIRDRIAQNTRYMSQYKREQAFQILHYDAFLPQACKRIGIFYPTPSHFMDDKKHIQWEAYRHTLAELLFAHRQRIIDCSCQYDTILIDEAQDYESEWFELIEQLFLTTNAEFMVVADEKQNLYDRALENKLPRVPGFHGPWRKLESSYRLPKMVFNLACAFQNTFMANKYMLDLNECTCLSSEKGSYHFFSVPNTETDKMAAIWKIIDTFRQDGNGISPNDICVLLDDINSIRTLEHTIKSISPNLNVLTMCETSEEYEFLRQPDEYGDIHDFEIELALLRNMRKFRFNMNSGTMKLCTIHSFKGVGNQHSSTCA